MIEIMEVNEEGKKNKEINEALLIVFKKCVRKISPGANYICRNEETPYIFHSILIKVK